MYIYDLKLNLKKNNKPMMIFYEKRIKNFTTLSYHFSNSIATLDFYEINFTTTVETFIIVKNAVSLLNSQLYKRSTFKYQYVFIMCPT